MASIYSSKMWGGRDIDKALSFFKKDDAWIVVFDKETFPERYRWAHIELGIDEFWMLTPHEWVLRERSNALLLSFRFD